MCIVSAYCWSTCRCCVLQRRSRRVFKVYTVTQKSQEGWQKCVAPGTVYVKDIAQILYNAWRLNKNRWAYQPALVFYARNVYMYLTQKNFQNLRVTKGKNGANWLIVEKEMNRGITGWAKKVIPLVQFQNTQTLTVNKLNIRRWRPKIVVIMTSYS